MTRSIPHLPALEAELFKILRGSPTRAFTLTDLKSKIDTTPQQRVGVDDVRAGLWRLYYQAIARPVSGDDLEQRWRLAEHQTTNLGAEIEEKAGKRRTTE